MLKVQVMASGISTDKEGCEWAGCKTKHDEKPTYELEVDGVVERGPYEGGWFQPFLIDLPSYKNHGVKEGENRNLVSTRYKDIKNSSCAHYSTQNHHVIPVDVLDSMKKIKENLKKLGWNLNNGILNGICLPYFKEDYIWHNLQPHRGSHPKDYINKVEVALENVEAACGDFCKGNNQKNLLSSVNKSVTRIRNGILDWKYKIHRPETLNKWKGEVISRKKYTNKKNGKNDHAPIPTQNLADRPSGRKYFNITIE